MANVRLPASTRNAMVDAVAAKIDAASGSPNAGRIRIYSGTQPASGGGALGAAVLLAEIPFGDPSFAAAAAGVAAANITGSIQDAAADATGTAAWARIVDGDGNTVFDCDVGTSGATINLVTVSLVATQPVQITSFNLTQPSGE
jgi:hypothetical protein